MMRPPPNILWIDRQYDNCSGCRMCEIVCSLHHEGQIWPEASRVRVFMLIPGIELPHLCVQCHDYPCVDACPVEALSIHEKTGAVIVETEKCTACGICKQRCQVHAVSIDEVAKIDLAKCLGCGLCVTGCPDEAVKLVKKSGAEIIHPPETYKDWEIERLRNRGLL